MKKVISLVLTLLLCFSFSVTISAKNVFDHTAQPYYEKAREAASLLSISSTTVSCKSTLKGYPDVTEITAVQTLEKQGFFWNWSTYDDTEWTKTVYSNTLIMSNTKPGLENGKYRLKTVFTITDKQGKPETITVYSEEKSVG